MSDAPMIELPLSSLMARLPDGFALRPCTAERYHDMLEVLPPVAWVSAGFLVGEPYDHRPCGVMGDIRPSWSVFVDARRPGGQHYEGSHALTVPEWRLLARRADALHEAIARGEGRA